MYLALPPGQYLVTPRKTNVEDKMFCEYEEVCEKYFIANIQIHNINKKYQHVCFVHSMENAHSPGNHRKEQEDGGTQDVGGRRASLLLVLE